ncbi:MAG TPA: GNAT family N-acetyltransferase [Blastocatellia bacterium]|jgi:GNAT superfamily N-acetyltransferase|nr:GNAT family N-acetyltransferase [Blastocatellia bacterium]
MRSQEPTIDRLLTAIPDQPQWVELRAMLLSGQCEVYGLEDTERLSFVARHAEMELVSVYGRPALDTIRHVIALRTSPEAVLCPPDDRGHVAEALPEWRSELATIYRLPNSDCLPEVPAGAVRLLSSSDIEAMDHAPDELKEELIDATKWSPVAATCVEQLPVSFCYGGSQTESLWDISIDTLDEYRNRGYAALCVAFLIEYFRRRDLAPVWGAVESNIPSMRLAAKLGFTPVGKLVVFEQSDQAGPSE